MLRYIFATICISCVSGYAVQTSADVLEWPGTYTLKTTKYSLTSNLVEEFKIWQSNSSTRVDYNNGAVKAVLYSFRNDDGESSTVSYEVHPETYDGETAEVVCNERHADTDVPPESLLDNLIGQDAYEPIGNETINDEKTIKFESFEVDEDDQEKKINTLWAYFNDFEQVWVPVRYELKAYHYKVGALVTHEIWDFSEFSTVVYDDDFNMDDICNDENTVLHEEDSEKITRELMFISPYNNDHVEYVFGKYVEDFEREYSDYKEHAMRKAIFHENMRMVSTVNKKKLGYTLALNHFSDRTPEEMERSRGLKSRPEGKSGTVAFPYDNKALESIVDDLPKDHDLRLLGLVSSVKNQGDCGSCWTYGTTAAVEGALARANGGRLMSLANQALVDCVWPYGASGCEGGTDNAAYDWMIDYGLPTEEEYGPYKNKDDFCHIKNMTTLYPIRGWTDVTPFSDTATKVAVVKYGPLSTSVHVTRQFSHYSRGIFYEYDCDPTVLNHEVTMVGYGEKDGDLFWILKNSWGTSWGIDGYMHISAKDNSCGPTTEPTYVLF